MRCVPGDLVRLLSVYLFARHRDRVLLDVLRDDVRFAFGVIVSVPALKPQEGRSNQLLFVACTGQFGYVWNEFVERV